LVSNKDELWPVAVVDDRGALLDVALFSDRARKSSVERGVLWVVHRETGRVLPYHGEPRLAALEDRGPWSLAQVQGTSGPAGNAAPPAGAAGSASSETACSGSWQVLADLAATIRDRRRQLPEGSYTTYLFQAGFEKIRKKTAEEAVELVLAQNRADMVSEAADLLYHLLVFLEAAGIDPEAVQEELRSRE
jgi:phosphoribosyl-AMP cyclohydrolase / phosphoribosyl-ATP pyrophosphohydrolase